MVGSPSGLSGQLRLSSKSALNMALNYDFRNEWIWTGGDLRWFALKIDQSHARGYFGLGGQVFLGSFSNHNKGDSTFSLIGRVPFGLEYQQPKSQWSFFIEVAPTLGLIPALDIGLQGGAGFRYFL